MMFAKRPLSLIFIAAYCAFSLAGCSILVGNVKPVDEKSEKYGIEDLSASRPDWTKLAPSQEVPDSPAASGNTDAFSSDIADAAYQNKKTASIISVNSSCRSARPDDSLEALTNELLLGLPSNATRDEKQMTVSGLPALQTTVEGPLSGQVTRIRTIVVRKKDCVYDLMYVARPQHFDANEPDFTGFVSSLVLR